MQIQPQLKQIHGDTLIILTFYHLPRIVKHVTEGLLKMITGRDRTWVVILNNAVDPELQEYYDSISHPQCFKFDFPFNVGKALASNLFFQEYIHSKNLPQTIVSMDPDIRFSAESLNHLIDASIQLPHCGVLGMRYEDNACNPERNIFFSPKALKGLNNKIYKVSKPFMSNVGGGVFAIQGEKVLRDCNNQLFPVNISMRKFRPYLADDAALGDALKWKYINGYLEGSKASHLASGDYIVPEFREP